MEHLKLSDLVKMHLCCNYITYDIILERRQ